MICDAAEIASAAADCLLDGKGRGAPDPPLSATAAQLVVVCAGLMVCVDTGCRGK